MIGEKKDKGERTGIGLDAGSYSVRASPPLPLRFVTQDNRVAWEVIDEQGITRYMPRIGVMLRAGEGPYVREPLSDW